MKVVEEWRGEMPGHLGREVGGGGVGGREGEGEGGGGIYGAANISAHILSQI